MAKSDLERFFEYTRAFELAFMADAWDGLEPFFAEGAEHVVHHGGPFGDGASGRAALIDDLRRSAERVDRRFDARLPEVVAGPLVRPDGVWMRWAMTLRRAGLPPDLTLEGDHLTRYEAGRIASIEEWLAPDVPERVAAYLAEHGGALRPPGAPFNAALAPADARDLETAIGRTLARCYANAKSAQDVGAALAVCSDDFVLETVSLGVVARGKREAAAQLEAFFAAFPDYAVTVESTTADPASVACRGRARMTFAGPLLGLAPTGRTAELPFVSIFPVRGGALAGEVFLFDAATLCEQIALPLASLNEALAPLRAGAADAAGTDAAGTAGAATGAAPHGAGTSGDARVAAAAGGGAIGG